jgi:L-ascorbate metabolism protein UlaG (beta-lactamase superfamily)
MVELQYFGHSFVKLKGKNGTIIIDPVFNSSKTDAKRVSNIPAKLKDIKDISLILITNDLKEQFDKVAVEELAKKNNAIVVAHDFLLNDLNIPRDLKASIIQGSSIFLKGFKIKTQTAHCPQAFCSTGFLIDCDGKKIYHAGTTRLLETFSQIDADLALLPISNKTMDVVDVVRAAKIMKPKKLIPIHHGIYDLGSFDPKDIDRRIKESVLKTETILLSPGKKITV